MANPTKQTKNVLTSVTSAVSSLFTHPEILYPYAIIAFVQFLVLEILYFYPRYPLSIFFEPLITRIYSPEFMHYSANLALLPKLFQTTQVPMYILMNSFFIGVAIAIIVAINEDKKIVMKKIFNETLKSYIHLALASLVMFLVIFGIFKIYGMVTERALMIGATEGPKFLIKTIVLKGAPYFQFVISVLVTTLFAYVLPVIVVDKRKIFSALIQNFKTVFSSFFFTFFVVLIPSLLYVLILLVRMNFSSKLPAPEWQVGLIAVNILVLIFIDAVVYTAVTTYYLLQKENR